MKPTFLQYEKPLLCAMIQCTTPEACIAKIRLSIVEGAEAIGIQLENLKTEDKSKEKLTEIFKACEGLPIYITNYNHSENKGKTEDEIAEEMLVAVDAGATLIDVYGDMFEKSPQYQLSTDPAAVEKQKALIAKIHEKGGEVLISSHTFKDISADESVMIAKAHIERGADVIKIVNNAESKDRVCEHLTAIQRITAMTDKKLLLLVSGEGQLIRYIGPNFGVCMYLTVAYHGKIDTPQQPLLRRAKAIRDNIRFDI